MEDVTREIEDAIAALKVCMTNEEVASGCEVILADQVRRLERVVELLEKSKRERQAFC